MQTKYSKTFKIEVVKKVVLRGADTSIRSMALSHGVKVSTLYGWIKAVEGKALTEDPPTSGGPGEKIPYHWSTSERLQAVTDTGPLTRERLSEYCRSKGIFPHHIEQWKEEFIKPKANSDSKNEIKELKKEVKRLNAELHRKDRALAETAALLVLKKKAHQYWGDNEDD
jgi:transposase-like protein